jgi:FAD dependent oxidoreductase
MFDKRKADLLVVGGGVGGCACALAACQAGLSVILTEESDWIGGQFTAQATPPDEHGWIEQWGCTASYRQFRQAVRNYYREQRPLIEAAKNDPYLNPGNGWVSPLCAEPRVFWEVLMNWMQPWIANGQLQILTRCIAIKAEIQKWQHVRSLRLRQLLTQEEWDVTAAFFVDATEYGDLLPMTQTDFVTGAESQAMTGEPSAKASYQPHNVQAFSVCFAMSYHEGQDHRIEEPEDYLFWKNFVPQLSPPWSGPLLRLEGLSPRTLQPVRYNFAPNHEPNKAFAGLWTYRRILHQAQFVPGSVDSDITLVNYPQIDFLLGDLLTSDLKEREKIIRQAKNQSLSFLYFLQKELGFKGLQLRPDVVGSADGLAQSPYIRESRRIKALVTVREQDVSAQLRPGQTLARPYEDSVGIGFYRIDLHPSTGGDNYLDVESLPFQIPLGALIPQQVDNLLPACKNIGTTHITNGCYRLHPIEWNIGEVVGWLVAHCLRTGLSPQALHQSPQKLYTFQQMLVDKGVEIAWPTDLDLAHGDPHRHAL